MSIASKAESKNFASEALQAAAERSQKYLRELGGRSVYPEDAAVASIAHFHEPLPDQPSNPVEVVRMLDEFGSPATVATAGGRYFGFVIGGALPASLAAGWLVRSGDQNAVLRIMSPLVAEIEDVVIQWVCDVLKLPAGCEGGIVTCATTANFTALAAARHALLAKAGWNVADDGMFGAPPIDVVV